LRFKGTVQIIPQNDMEELKAKFTMATIGVYYDKKDVLYKSYIDSTTGKWDDSDESSKYSI
jgi:hypothetical protein